MNILSVASEVAPYSKSGGLGDVAHALPVALTARGHTVRVVTPLYATAKVPAAEDSGRTLRLRFPYGEEQGRIRVARPHPGHEVWFLDHPGFYGRSGLYGDSRGDFRDNHRRFAFLSVGALVAAQVLGFQPDVVHLNDWQTGLGALALAGGFRGTSLGAAGCLFTIHNLAYQGLFPKSVMGELGLPWSAFTASGLEFYDQVNFMKAGIAFADEINTVSETYAREIQTQEYGCMLEGILRARAERLHGILNGIDVREWDPRRDPLIPAPYDVDELSGKAVCKAELRRRFGLPDPERLSRRPLFGVVSRLAAQKGIALLLESIPWLLAQGAEVVLLGSGERRYEDGFRSLAAASGDLHRIRARAVSPGGGRRRLLPHALAVRALWPEPDVLAPLRDRPHRARHRRAGGHRPRCRPAGRDGVQVPGLRRVRPALGHGPRAALVVGVPRGPGGAAQAWYGAGLVVGGLGPQVRAPLCLAEPRIGGVDEPSA